MARKPIIAVTLSSRELPRMVHWRRMFEGLLVCGAIPMGIDCGSAPLDLDGLMENVDGLLISGGGDVDPTLYGGDPNDPTLSWVNTVRDGNETSAFEAAWSRGLPTLAICRGAQLINAVRGGTLYTDLERDHPSDIPHRLGEDALTGVAHQVNIVSGSRVAGWIGTDGDIAVNSQHHQGIRTLASDFTPTAHAPDGLVEAFESTQPPVTAVQWHPEINWETNEASYELVRAFVLSCEEHAATSTPVALTI